MIFFVQRWLATRRRLQRELERLERQRAVEQERTRIARDIHDDIGASLTQMALLSELAQVDLAQPELVRVHLDQIFTTAHGLARQLDEIVWAINPAYDTLEEFTVFLCKFAQDYLGAASLRCRLDVPEALPARELSSAARHALFLCTKEALHNIVKHAAASEVWLRLQADDPGLALVVEDDGKPLSAGGPAGDGLGNMKARLKDIGGEFTQRNGQDRGTVTKLMLPWGRP